MKKNTLKIKNHFVNLGRLAFILLFISVFTEVNAQSSVNADSKPGTTPVAITPVTPQSSLNVTPAPDASDALVNELKTVQPEPGTMNATIVIPSAPVANPAAVKSKVPAATQQKKHTDDKQPK